VADNYDAVVIGGGPAGMTAGLYLFRTGRTVVVLESAVPGGKAFLSPLIENYPGFIEPVQGKVLAGNMHKQLQRVGVELRNTGVDKIEKQGKVFKISGYNLDINAKAVVVATGATPKKIGVQGEEQFYGTGVSYCSTCDGMFFKDKDVVVVGGGNSAVGAAEHLSRICKSVTIVHRRNEFRANKVLVKRLLETPNIKVFWSSELLSINGTDRVTHIKLKKTETGEVADHKCDGVFIYAGYAPKNDLVRDLLTLDETGYIIADNSMATSCKGLFAAGDIIVKSVRQIVTAISDGCIAAISADKYISSME
jgi:thioredoxin reductase (NADPH)